MGVRDTLGAFNRYVANVNEVMPLKNNPLNSVLFIGTTEKKELEVHSGGISFKEIEDKFSSNKELKEKIKTALSQKDVGGNPILPARFFTGGIKLDTDDVTAVEMLIKKVAVDNGTQAVTIVFDNPVEVIKKDEFIKNLDTVLNGWDSWCILSIDKAEQVTETLKATSKFIGIKTHKTGEDTFEKNVDAALAGRVIFMGVGKVDGIAKELYGITSDKLSLGENDGGDLTTSEADKWEKTYNTNIYVQNVDGYNETSGMIFFSGREFINNWELTKVKIDLRNDLVQLRHEKERMGVSDIDEAAVRGAIVDRLNKLMINKENPELTPQALLVDYIVQPVPLDRTLEDNIFKFKYNIKVSLSGILKYFDLSITGYTDGRVLVEGGDE